MGVVQAALRFLRQLGSPRLIVEHEGGRLEARAPLVSVANGAYVGAAHALAPNARIDDGLLDVVVFRRSGVLRVLIHLAFVATPANRPSRQATPASLRESPGSPQGRGAGVGGWCRLPRPHRTGVF